MISSLFFPVFPNVLGLYLTVCFNMIDRKILHKLNQLIVFPKRIFMSFFKKSPLILVCTISAGNLFANSFLRQYNFWNAAKNDPQKIWLN